MSPKVSVIIPVYNASAHLESCLDSVIHQTLQDIEIICVNDGSTDSSAGLLEEYAQKDSRIRVITQQNAGAGAARNRGLDAAQGEYLSFLDSDDFFEMNMLEKAYRKACAAKSQIVVFRSNQYYEDRNAFVEARWTIRASALPPYRPMNRFGFTENVFKVFVGWAWDKLFLHDFVTKNNLRFQEIRTSNDMLFVFLAVVLADRIDVLEDVLAHQRRNNPGSLSNTREQSWGCFHEALIALKKNLQERDLFWQLEQDYINYALHASIWNVETMKEPGREQLYRKLKEEWFTEFGITGKPMPYFYHSGEYDKYMAMRRKSCSAYIAGLERGKRES